MTQWFDEDDAADLIIRFQVEREIHREKSPFQDLVIFDHKRFGRTLALDGIVQTTEADECAYHEMIAQVPLLAHGAAERVLVIGGGDGGTLREVFKHPVEKVTLVELDERVVVCCREHLPALADGAFEEPRLEMRFEDGVKFMAESQESFDLILVDSTDPLPGPGEVLFTESFYADCKRRLNPGGIVISQLGMPFLYPEAVAKAGRNLKSVFADVTFYIVAVPVFAGGYMAFSWASDDPALRQVPEAKLAERHQALGLKTRFYTPAFHRAAFALPADIAALVPT
ncbi:MAG: polyamine aminopropyltransferase [Pseudomonadota bacterium]